MTMPGRKYNQPNSGYRYGFNGKELDNSTGEGNLDFGARIMDVRLGRFLSVDPLTAIQPFQSPYTFAGNKPIVAIDKNGEIIVVVTLTTRDSRGKVIDNKSVSINFVTAEELVYGLSRTPVHLQITANETMVDFGSNAKISQSVIFSVEQTGGFDEFESKLSVIDGFDKAALRGGMAFANYTGIKSIMEAGDGKTIEGMPLSEAARVSSGISGVTDFAKFITGGTLQKVVSDGIAGKIEDVAVDSYVSSIIEAVFQNVDKNTSKEQYAVVLKSVVKITLEAVKSEKNSVIKMFTEFLNGADALGKINKAITNNPTNSLPFGRDEAAAEALNLIMKKGGFGGVEATVKELEPVTVEASSKSKTP
jgi:RHS repeat-associated protein